MGRPVEYTEISRNEIAASGLGVSPRGIASYEDLQRAAFSAGPAASEAAQAAADQAALDAAASQAAADGAQATADSAQATGAAAQVRADAAYDLAGTKVTKNVGAAWAAASGTASRAAYAAYTAPTISNPPTQAEVQAIANALQALSRAQVALITDLRANGVLTT